jgi:NAD(P)H-flavin reductase
MFPISMSAQRDKLVGALATVVSGVDRLDEVTPVLQQLGRDHRRFAVVAEHYPAVGASLLATLQYFLGPQWTESLAGDWAAAYGLIAKVMVQAAEEAAETSPSWWLADVVAAERRTLDVAVIQLRPHEEFGYQAGQSFALEVPQRPRLWRYFSPANAPRDDGSIELHVQLVAGGQVSSAIVRSLHEGDTVRMGSPIGGRLSYDGNDSRDIMMVAGGTGLAPLRSVLEQLDRQWQATADVPRVHLFHGVRMPWNLYEHERMNWLAQRPWFDYMPVVSDDVTYPGAKGLVGAVAAQSPVRAGRRVMVCGSAEMVRHSIEELTRAGTSRDEISYDEFSESSSTQTGGDRTKTGDGQ